MYTPNTHRILRTATTLTLAALLLPSTGCSWFRKKPQPTVIQPSSFSTPIVTADSPTPPTPDNTPNTDASIDESLNLTPTPPVAGNAPTSPADTTPLKAFTPPNTIANASPDGSLSGLVREIPPTPLSTVSTEDPARATPAKPITLSGTYMTIGGVLAEVNGVPIFAAKVMKELEPALAARARELNPRQFEIEARNLIDRTINEFISEELEYATAQRSLSADERKFADALTVDWRQKRIVEAGGSLENAKRLAAENGEDFEEMVEAQSRKYLVQLYYEKKVRPRVSNATTADMRRYYKDNQTKLFTEQTEAAFLMIRVDPTRHGGKQQALDRLIGIRDRITKGEDFAALAANMNDDAALARRSGNVGKIQRGSFALEKVEEAVFRTPEGQVTEIIEDRGGFYIALVNSVKIGKTLPFEDPDVQQEIRSKLFAAEIGRMREQARAELTKNALVRRDPQMIKTALEMASQRYPLWRAEN